MDDRWLDDFIRIEDASTETFELFSEVDSGHDLGIVAPRDHSLDITIGQHDFTIAQSPALLQSDRAEGTTGAVLWRSSLHLAQWLSRSSNVLSASGPLNAGNIAIELGAGSAAITTVILAKKLGRNGRVIATDIGPAMKLLQQNVTAHVDILSHASSKARGVSASKPDLAEITVKPLDWEHDDAASLLASCGIPTGVDLLLSCDCIYNYALVKPFLDTCKDICRIRSKLALDDGLDQITSTYCVIAQQLRQPEVFEEWLETALLDFDVWRTPNSVTAPDFSTTTGYAVHVMRLRTR